MKFSYDAKLGAAMLARVGHTLPPDSCWAEVDALIAAAPAGDTAQTAEHSPSLWNDLYWMKCDALQWASCRPADWSVEAAYDRLLDALRVNTPGPEAAKERA